MSLHLIYLELSNSFLYHNGLFRKVLCSNNEQMMECEAPPHDSYKMSWFGTFHFHFASLLKHEDEAGLLTLGEHGFIAGV